MTFEHYSLHHSKNWWNSVVSIEYNERSKKLEELTGKVVLEKLNETILQKEIALKGKEDLEAKYSDLKNEDEDLARENEKLKLELSSAKSELDNTKTRFDTLQSQFKQVQNSLMKTLAA